MTHTELTEAPGLTHSTRARRGLLGAVAALAAAAVFAIPGVVSAASLDVDAEASFQEGATTYTVASVTLDADGYVVVHEGTETEFGDVIGASDLLEAGTHADVEITLDRAIEDGEYLWVMAHEESNDNTTFDGPTVDLGVVDETNGNPDLTGDLAGLLAFPVLQTLSVQAEGGFEGDISASGVSLVVFTGETLENLVAAATEEGLISVAATVDGQFVMYIVGAPAFVNAEFNAEFADGFGASTPVAVTR